MATNTLSVRYQLRHDIESEFTTKNPILLSGEVAIAYTSEGTKVKIGENKAFNDTPYVTDFSKSSISAYGHLLSSLTIQYIEQEEYYRLVSTNNGAGIDPNTLYILSGTYSNNFGEQIKNVADPTDEYDAATKNYVDQEILKEATERSNADNELSLSLLNKQNSLPQNQGTGVYGISTQYALSTSSATTSNTAISVQWSGVQNKAIASATELGLIKVGSNLTIDSDGTLNATGGGGSGSTEGIRYKLITKTLQEGTYNDQSVLTCQIDDRTTTTIVVSSNEKDVVLYLPPKPDDGGARDFIIRVEVTASTAPGFYFVGVSETINYDSDSDDWSVLEPGLNLISFTETK